VASLARACEETDRATRPDLRGTVRERPIFNDRELDDPR
jgi:hypothetical protein